MTAGLFVTTLVCVNENLIAWLDQQFVVRDYPGVLRLLRAHPLLQPLLWEAAERVAGFFGPVTMVLDIDIDPEGDVEPRLCLGIVTDLEPEQALEKLDLFDAAWWLDAMQQANDKLCITLAYG